MLKTLVCLIDPGSEWRLHRHGYDNLAQGDRLAEDAALADSHKLHPCLDQILAQETALFPPFEVLWQILLPARFQTLLRGLTNTAVCTHGSLHIPMQSFLMEHYLTDELATPLQWVPSCGLGRISSIV